MSARLDLDAIRERHPLQSVIGATVALKQVGAGWRGLCPFHSDRSPSFEIYFKHGRWNWYCHPCGAGGDVFDFLRRLHGCSLREAVEMLERGAAATGLPDNKPAPVNSDRDTRADAIKIWRNATAPEGTPVEAYLRSRGITMLIPPTIRFAKLSYGWRGPCHPCLVALVTTVEGQIGGVQRIYLTADGRKLDVEKPKLSLGRVKGGAIRLAPQSPELLVTEGLEDALTLQQELKRWTWAAAGVPMLSGMQFPGRVRSVVIAADNDAAGAGGAAAAKDAFERAGLSVRIMRPAGAYKDFNEQLLSTGPIDG